MQLIKEGKALLNVKKTATVSSAMPVFYNPVMEVNRTLSVLLLNTVTKKKMQIADPLAGSGIRSIRFLKELDKGKVKSLSVNDGSLASYKSIVKNFTLNKIKNFTLMKNKNIKGLKREKILSIDNVDANLFLLQSAGFDYIDIDPFGSPNAFLDSSMRRLSRDGILAVTATDTGALCGTFPAAGKRKYWTTVKKSVMMHETGLRILIRKVQLIGAQYDKALWPIFSYSLDHYFRVFFRCEKGKQKVDTLLAEIGTFSGCGEMWLGKLWDTSLVGKMHATLLKQYKKIKRSKNNYTMDYDKTLKLLKTIKEESKIIALGFFDLNDLCSKGKLKEVPKKEKVMQAIKKAGYKVAGTHFRENSLRSTISEKILLKILRNLNR